MVFFELSNHQNHRLFCTCHSQGTMTADRVAAQLRGMAAKQPLLEKVDEVWPIDLPDQEHVAFVAFMD